MLSAAPASPAPDEPIEEIIGDVVAAAAIALMAAVQEWQANGERLGTVAIKQKSKANGDLIAHLYELRQATLGEIADFEDVARVYGEQALRQRFNGGWNPIAGGIYIDGVMDILHRVTAVMKAWPN
jgi:hypothetical protein